MTGRLSSSEWIWEGQPIQLPDTPLLLEEETSSLKAAEMEITALAGADLECICGASGAHAEAIKHYSACRL